MKSTSLVSGLLCLATLAACSGENGSNEIRNAPTVELSAAALGSAPGGSPKSFNRAEGEYIQLETGLVNIFPLELQPCSSAAFGKLLDALLPAAAQAHGGHAVEVPPGVFDAVGKADGEAQALGSLAVGAGSYCGLRVALLPVATGALAGKAAAVGPCFYASSGGLPPALAEATSHECWLSELAGASAEKTLPLPQPLAVTAGAPAALRLSVDYRRWFDGLDMDQLHAADASELAKLRENLLNSLAVLGAAN